MGIVKIGDQNTKGPSDPALLAKTLFEPQPNMDSSIVWQQNRLAESRYNLTPREQKLVAYVISMIEPQDDAFRLYKINVGQFADSLGIERNSLYQELRETALKIKSKPLVIPNHMEPGSNRPKELITSWFADVLLDADGDGYFAVNISALLKPYLLKVKSEFFNYKLTYVMRLKSAYAIRFYQWAKRWQFAGQKRITIAELRMVMGAYEIGSNGQIKKELLPNYKNFKQRALTPAIEEVNEKTDLRVHYLENRMAGSKAVESITFSIRENPNKQHLDPLPVPEPPQMEFKALEAEADRSSELDILVADIVTEFGLSKPQSKTVRQYALEGGIQYVQDKMDIVRSKPRKNAAGALLAALRDDWKSAVEIKPAKKTVVSKSAPRLEIPLPDISPEEEEDERKKRKAMMKELREKAGLTPRKASE